MKTLVVLASLLAFACGSSPPTQPDAATPAIDATPDAAPHLQLGTIQESGSQAPIAGAQVCVLHHAEIPCAMTDAAGAYTIALSDLQGQAIAVEATAQGHIGAVALAYEPVDQNGVHITVWPGSIFLQSDAAATSELATEAGFTYPGGGTGFLLIREDGANVGTGAGATIAIAPSSGKGPVYYGANGPDPQLTTASANGAALFGNLAPGIYKVTVTMPQKTCAVTRNGQLIAGDWPTTGAETTDVEVAADAKTLGINIRCL